MKILKLVLFSVFVAGVYSLFATNVSAQGLTYTYPKYDVSIKINQDSTFTVKEDVLYKFYGTAHGLRRDLTLSDPNRDANCATTSGLSCGGFGRVEMIAVHDDKGNYITNRVNLYN